MPARVKAKFCKGDVNGPDGCFYARSVYDNWNCDNCGVTKVDVLGSNSYRQFCIVCFYGSDGVHKCNEAGCTQMRKIVRERQKAMPQPDQTSSLESDAGPANAAAAASSNDTQEQLASLKEELHVLKTRLNETHKVLEDEIVTLQEHVSEHRHKLEYVAQCLDKWTASSSWYGNGKWGTSVTNPSTGTSSGSNAWSATIHTLREAPPANVQALPMKNTLSQE